MGAVAGEFGMPQKILILTAAVAGGHEAAGRALQAELESGGFQAVVMDGIKPMGGMVEWLLYPGYEHLLRYVPRAYGLFFRIATSRPGAAWTRFLVGRTCAERLQAVVELVQPDAVVSTYPFITAALGYLRQRGDLTIPTVAIIPDYGVHRMWVAPGVDLHLVPSQASVALATAAGGRARLSRIPLAPAFLNPPPRESARSCLELPSDRHIALVVGGAWGIGDVVGAVDTAIEAGWYPVVVTGTNTALQARLSRRFPDPTQARILGWTEDMPRLMAAADCLIQNAGGMTCLEAIAVGLPILLNKAIPGHGELNARVMAQAGVARRIEHRSELRHALADAASGRQPLDPPLPPPHETSLSAIQAILAGTLRVTPAAQHSHRRVLLPAALAAPLCWLVLTALGQRVRGRLRSSRQHMLSIRAAHRGKTRGRSDDENR